MFWYVNLPIRKKLWLLTGSFFVSLLMVVLAAFWTQQKMASDMDEIAGRYFIASQLLLEADAKLYRAISAERSVIFVNATSPQFGNLVNYHKLNISEATEKFEQFKRIMQQPEIASLMRKYAALSEQWQALTFMIIELRQNNGREQRREASQLSLNDASRKFAEMHDVIDQIIAYVNSESKRTVSEAQSNQQYAAALISVVAIIVLVLGSILTVVSIKLISQPLADLIERLQQISSGDGDLTQRLDENRKDEIGAMASAFNRFIANQATIIGQVKSTMQSLMTSMEYVSDNMHKLHEATSIQQTESDQVAESMGQMSVSVTEVSVNASQASQSTQEANTLAVKGQQVVSESVITINDITASITATSEVVGKLDSRAQSISSVTNNISEIADQTNLLALNAAIEAARAGEQGRGFAVVADEVRNLANRTQDLTKQIPENIDSLSSESSEAVRAMQESLDNSNVLDEKAVQSGQALQDIALSVDAIAGMNMTVASAVEEQSVTSEEISRSIEHLKEKAIESDQRAQQTLAKIDSLTGLAAEMQVLLNRFKVEQD